MGVLLHGTLRLSRPCVAAGYVFSAGQDRNGQSMTEQDMAGPDSPPGGSAPESSPTSDPRGHTPPHSAKACTPDPPLSAAQWRLVLSLTEEGCSLREIAERSDMPGWHVLRRHVRGSGARAAGFARARMLAAEAFEDRLINELETIKGEDTAAMRLRIDTLKWLMARRAPARYGEKAEESDARPERPAVVRRVIIDPPDPSS
jgi:hypothetical protein